MLKRAGSGGRTSEEGRKERPPPAALALVATESQFPTIVIVLALVRARFASVTRVLVSLAATDRRYTVPGDKTEYVSCVPNRPGCRAR